MLRLIALGGYGLWRLSRSHRVGETTATDGWVGESWDCKSKDAKMSSNSDIMVEVRETVAASTFARHCEMASILEMTNFGYSIWSSCPQVTTESRSPRIGIGSAKGMAR